MKNSLTDKLIKKNKKVLAVISLSLLSAGCYSPLADWHTKTREPVKGAIPYALAGSLFLESEKHHGYTKKDYGSINPPTAITLIDYP